MITFLESVLEDYDGWRKTPEQCIFVLPSKRAGSFLKNLLVQKTEDTSFAPRILSIESFVEEISGLQYASTIRLMFDLYAAYSAEEGFKKDSFYEFSRWGQMLLQDFNEIDRYLVNATEFFDYLGSLQEIRHWTPEGTSTPMIDKQVKFWKSLFPIYTRFRDRLEQEGLGYQGQIYRKATAKVGAYLQKHDSFHYVFAGFNALNKSEEYIIREILNQQKADIFWDADSHYLENPVHDAGYFLRTHFASWDYLKTSAPKGVGSFFNAAKTIQITGLPKNIAQAKYTGALIENLLEKDQDTLDKTALILGDETLLNPILHSLPESLTGVNITMGYPLKDSSLAHLFSVLFQIFGDKGQKGIPTKKILVLFSNPFLQEWFLNLGFVHSAVTGRMVRENKPYLSDKDFEYYGLPMELRRLLSLQPYPDPGTIISRFIALLENLQTLYLSSQDLVSVEFLRHFHLLFNQLSELHQTYPFITDTPSLFMLYEQLLEEDTLDFEGKPLEGLQIMGMLESRCLDFETVILTSVNEGVLPAGKSNNSFIPFEVKREFDLPTYKEKDAVYTYHFYRLLQRAKKIYICYNTEPDVLNGGEPSRFIHQLRNDSVLSESIRNNLAAPESGIAPSASESVQKSPSLLAHLAQKASKGFSPTSLSRYIQDPLEFYRKNVLGIRDTLELEETIAANTFGNVIHETLEILYRPCLGHILKPFHLVQMKKLAIEVLPEAFEKHYLKGSKLRGKNLLALRVMEKYLDLFLELEAERIVSQEVCILGVEKELIRELTDIPGFSGPVNIKGTVDRIETVDGELRIVDYKTGRVDPSNLRIADWGTLSEDPGKSKAFQVLCYAWLLQEHMPIPASEFRAGVFSFKRIGSGFQWFGLKTAHNRQDEMITPEMLNQFQGVLKSLVAELFNPEIPFTPPEKT
ncbi:MAG: PD-(D/E)XK nuclease family protein [Robiginitalea sp.]|uniref:PD-(D/E)XK nuclease family protein n=1 Tax=Robiginitalea sp. TaxID=1902411 RepID=UPI003C75190B